MRLIVGVLLVLLVVAGVGGVATYSYNLGVAQGVVQSGKLPVSGPGTGPSPAYPYPVYPYGYPFHGPFGYGFGFFGFLGPILFIVLLFALLRGAFWRGYGWGGRSARGYGSGGPCGKGVPPRFEEWHRRVHESEGRAGTA